MNHEQYMEHVLNFRALSYMKRLKFHSSQNYNHSLQTAIYARILGESNSLFCSDLDKLYVSGLMHDIGKIFTPSEILEKKGKLDENEMELLKSHPKGSFDILNSCGYEDEAKIAVGHHEYGKNPYPRTNRWIFNCKKDGIIKKRDRLDDRLEVMSQIVAAADIFDGLTNRRDYREKDFSAHEAYEKMTSMELEFPEEMIEGLLEAYFNNETWKENTYNGTHIPCENEIEEFGNIMVLRYE